MTHIATGLATLVAAIGALAAGAALAPGAGHPAPRTAIVIAARSGRDGRALVDHRLRAVDADVRLPRDAAEARTDVRYFTAQGYERIVVAGPRATAGADGPAVVRVTDLPAALAAVRR